MRGGGICRDKVRNEIGEMNENLGVEIYILRVVQYTRGIRSMEVVTLF